MKTAIATAALTVMFLSAGAFAGIGHNHAAVRHSQSTNVTVILKNQAWPVLGETSLANCQADQCADI